MSTQFYQKEIQELEEQEIHQAEQEKQKDIRRETKRKEISERIEQFVVKPITNQEYYRLPQLVQFDFRTEGFEQGLEKLEGEVRQIVHQTRNYLLSNLKKWSEEESKEWQFTLPSSIFDDGKEGGEQQQGLELFELKQTQGEYTQVSKLQPEQLKQIRQNGQFDVPSQQYPVPYTWKLHPLIVKGKEEIQKSYYYDLSQAFSFVYDFKGFSQNINYTGTQGRELIFEIIGILVGLRSMASVPQYTVNEEMVRRRQKHLYDTFKNQLELALFDFFNVYDEEKLEGETAYEYFGKKSSLLEHKRNLFINNIDKLFEVAEKELKEKIAEKFNKLEGQEFFNAERDEMNKEMFRIIDQVQAERIPVKVLEGLKEVMTAIDIIQNQYKLFQRDFDEERKKIREIIKKEHKIKSLVNEWLNSKVEEHIAVNFSSQREEKLHETIKLELSKKNLKSSLILFKQFIEYQKNGNIGKQFAAIEQELFNQSPKPMRVFISRKYFFPPYEKKNLNEGNKSQNPNWILVKSKDYETKTDAIFWRYKLMAIRYYVWSVNAAFNLYENGIQGRYGLKALFYKESFFSAQSINYNTGAVSECGSVDTYRHHLSKIVKGIKLSRADFERKPDTGFFGKNMSRLFNYFECYIFRILILFLVAIAMPILVLVNFSASLVLGTTSFVWIPIALVLRLLINILFLDFDSDQRKNSGVSNRGRKFNLALFPLIQFSLRMVFQVLVAGFLWTVLQFGVIYPLIIAGLSLIACARKYLALLADAIMFFFVRKLGRVPVHQTKIARKIKGIGVGRSYFFSMDEEDLTLFFYSALERFELEEYQRRIQKKIGQPLENAVQLYTDLFGTFQAYSQNYYGIQISISTLQNLLSQQVYKRNQKFPRIGQLISQVRFTKEELSNLFPLAQNLITGFLKQRDLIPTLYENLGLDQKKISLDELARAFWVRSFGNEQTLEPLEEIETRITLYKEKDFSSNSIRNAIRGQVELSAYGMKLETKFRKSVDNNLAEFVRASQISQFLASYAWDRQWIDSPPFSVLLNIKQLKLEEAQKKIHDE